MKNLVWSLALRFLFFIAIILLFAYISYGHELERYKFPNDYRGIIHLHSELSPNSDGKFENIVEAAKNNKVDFVVMTDHWSPELYVKSHRGFIDNILFIAGAEISKNEGITLLALPLPKDFTPQNDWRSNVTFLRKKGSLALASHIEFSETAQLVGVDGIEITNLHAILVARSYFGFAWAWFKALWPQNWDLAYIFNSGAVEKTPRWHYLNQSVALPAFAGNDTRDNYRLFWKVGPKLGSYNNTFKLVTTHIWANELSEQSVIDAVKNGQSYFAFEVFGNAKEFRFYATTNMEVFLPGSIISQKIDDTKRVTQVTLTVQAPPHKDPKNTKLKILHNGKIVKEGFGILLNYKAKKVGNYYAEIWKNGKPWIFSNPIKIRSD